MTEYQKVFNRFLRKVTDFALYGMPYNEREEQLAGYMESAISVINLKGYQMGHDLNKRDDDFQEFVEDLSDGIQEVIALFMCVAWYEPKIQTFLLVDPWVGQKSESRDTQRNQLRGLEETKEKKILEAERLVKSYHARGNSYLHGN